MRPHFLLWSIFMGARCATGYYSTGSSSCFSSSCFCSSSDDSSLLLLSRYCAASMLNTVYASGGSVLSKAKNCGTATSSSISTGYSSSIITGYSSSSTFSAFLRSAAGMNFFEATTSIFLETGIPLSASCYNSMAGQTGSSFSSCTSSRKCFFPA